MAHDPYKAKNDLHHLMGLGGDGHHSSHGKGQCPDAILRQTLYEGGSVESHASGGGVYSKAAKHMQPPKTGMNMPHRAGGGANWHQGYAEGGSAPETGGLMDMITHPMRTIKDVALAPGRILAGKNAIHPHDQAEADAATKEKTDQYDDMAAYMASKKKAAGGGIGSRMANWHQNHAPKTGMNMPHHRGGQACYAEGGEVDEPGWGMDEQQPFHEAADEALPQDTSDYEPQQQAAKPRGNWGGAAQKVKAMRAERQAQPAEERQPIMPQVRSRFAGLDQGQKDAYKQKMAAAKQGYQQRMQPQEKPQEHPQEQPQQASGNDYRGGYKTGGSMMGSDSRTWSPTNLDGSPTGRHSGGHAPETGGLMDMITHPMRTIKDVALAPGRILAGKNAIHPHDQAEADAATKEKTDQYDDMAAYMASKKKAAGGGIGSRMANWHQNHAPKTGRD